MFCTMCGSNVPNGTVICPNCGTNVRGTAKPVQQPYGTPHHAPTYYPRQGWAHGTAVEVFMILSIVLRILLVVCGSAIYGVALLWIVPMTIYACSMISNDVQVSNAFKICTLLFVSLVAGIIMLCDNGY